MILCDSSDLLGVLITLPLLPALIKIILPQECVSFSLRVYVYIGPSVVLANACADCCKIHVYTSYYYLIHVYNT